LFFFGVFGNSPLLALINRVYLSIGVESVVDFSSAISELSIISKGSTLCLVIVEADCVGRQHLMVGMAPLVLANQEWLLTSTRRSYLHVLEARYAASRAEQLGTCNWI